MRNLFRASKNYYKFWSAFIKTIFPNLELDVELDLSW